MDMQAKCGPFLPRVGFLEKPAVVPERRFDGDPLVAEDTFQIRLVGLGQAPRFLDQSRVTDCFLTVDQIRKLAHNAVA